MPRMLPNSELVPGRWRQARTQPGVDPPYRVIIHNDDVTPMDFVVHVLMTIFMLPSPNAEHTMMTAHLNGHAYVQTLPAHEARRRINQATFVARLKQLPLQFSMEPE